jgi:23S rRNA pseudouridine2605 synthase
MPDIASSFAGDRLAKVIARAGLCSRRDAELWIKDGRVAVNGKVIRTPAFNVTEKDQVKVDGQPLQARQGTRVWLYHKPAGLVVTEKDPEGRPTIFETLEQQGLPRVVSIGRLDINTEGLLLLTNDGGLKRVLELPATGWLRKYRVRAFGSITQPQLDALKDGLEVEGVKYGPIEATLEREQGSNVWLVLALREGKNREVKNVLGALGLTVNRLIRVSFGPFQLSDLPIGGVEVVRARVLREQLGKRLADEAGVDFDSELPEPAAIRLARGAANPALRASKPGTEPARQRKAMADRTERFHFTDRPDRERKLRPEDAPLRKDRPGSRFPRRPPPDRREAPADVGPPRKVFNPDGTEALFVAKTYGKKPRPPRDEGDRPAFKQGFGDKPRDGDRKPFAKGPRKDSGDRPKRDFEDRPKRSFAEGGSRRSSPARSAGEGDHAQRGGGGGRTRDFADRPKRDFGSRDSSPAKRGRGTTRSVVEGAAPRSAARRTGDFADRPKRAYTPRPDAPAGDRPKRPYTPRSAAPGGDRPKRPYAPRSAEGADRPKRSFGDKPRAPRPAGDKPHGTRPAGDKPFVKRPRGSGPGGDRPRRPRKPNT